MGTGKVKAAVADAGPLIHLTEIGCFQLLCIFDALHIPDAVRTGLLRKHSGRRRLNKIAFHKVMFWDWTLFNGTLCHNQKLCSLCKKTVLKVCTMVNANVFTFARK